MPEGGVAAGAFRAGATSAAEADAGRYSQRRFREAVACWGAAAPCYLSAEVCGAAWEWGAHTDRCRLGLHPLQRG